MRLPVLYPYLLTSVLLVAQPACAESLTDLGHVSSAPAGFEDTVARGISADGTTVVGSSVTGSFNLGGFIWENGVMTEVGGLGETNLYAVSADGSVAVGSSYDFMSDTLAFSIENGVYTYLPHLGGSVSYAYGVSADGSVIVGQSNGQAASWTGGVVAGLGYLPGRTNSSIAWGVSSNGTIIVGSSQGAAGVQEAFRLQSGTMTALGDLPGGIVSSEALAISGDGNVIVGYGTDAVGNLAVRWVGGVIESLGELAGGFYGSTANAVNTNGSVIVGTSNDAGGAQAVRWTQAGGIQTLSSLLSAAGVDLTDWFLQSATGVDGTGNIVVGRGTYNGVTSAFIADLTTNGITTPEELAVALLPATQTIQQTQGAVNTSLGQSLFATTQALSSFDFSISSNPADIAPAAGGDFERKWSGYAVGSFGIGHDNDVDNRELNGTTGLIAQLADTLAVGVGIIGSTSRQDLERGGESHLKTSGGSFIAAYETGAGLRIYGTAFAADITVETDRNYLNGAAVDTSHGETDGFGYGAAVRAGWEFPVAHDFSVMPYGELQVSKVSLDGYTETDGGFPASFGKQESTRATSRLGLQLNYDINPSLSLGTRAAWAHDLKNDQNGLSVTTTGFSGVLNGEAGDRNWAEGAVSASWQVTPGTSLQGELSGRSNKTSDPAAAVTMGLKINF